MTIEHIFCELRYYDDRARAESDARDTRLGALVALSGAVVGLLIASAGGAHLPTTAVMFLCGSGLAFVLAILVASQILISQRMPWVSQVLGDRLEQVIEVPESEFDFYLDRKFQQAAKTTLQKRALPAMRTSIGARRRNLARKERLLDISGALVAVGIITAAAYGGILAI